MAVAEGVTSGSSSSGPKISSASSIAALSGAVGGVVAGAAAGTGFGLLGDATGTGGVVEGVTGLGIGAVDGAGVAG